MARSAASRGLSRSSTRFLPPLPAAIEQQTVATSEISRNLAEASRGTSSEVSNVDFVIGAVGRTQVAEAVDRSARDIRSTTETLNRAVDRFLDDVAAA